MKIFQKASKFSRKKDNPNFFTTILTFSQLLDKVKMLKSAVFKICFPKNVVLIDVPWFACPQTKKAQMYVQFCPIETDFPNQDIS